VAEWLVQTFGLTADNMRMHMPFWMLECCCRDGHLAVAKWLVRTFGLIANETTLRKSREHEHLDVVEWLTSADLGTH
jgi:hypothetical protein